MDAAVTRTGNPKRVRARAWTRERQRGARRILTGPYARIGKRGLSLAAVVLTVPLWAPLTALLYLLNAACGHGFRRALFAQDRIGRHGRRFRMYKLRTLRRGDRPTRLGRVLRRTHLDELPQLVNVLRGDMCLVGPRPETVAIESWANRGIPGFSRRLQLRPGITGLAQIRQGHVGPDLDAYREKLRWNDEYLSRLSLATDIGVLLRTVGRVLCCRGA